MLIINIASAQRRVERMDRGLIAMPRNSTQIYVSWRHFATDPDDISYNLYYRTSPSGSAIKVNSTPITNSTNFLTNLPTASADYTFFVTSIHKGIEKNEPGSFTVRRNSGTHRIVKDYNFHPLPAGYPAMVMKFCWPADLTGDGRYDYVIDRQNYGAILEDGEGGSSDYPSPKVEAYRSDGTFMWRINMGPNVKIASGHNDMVTAYDMDGDGKAEILLIVSEGTVFADGSMITGANGLVTNYRTLAGSAPQWLSIVNGETGVEIDRVPIPFFNAMSTTRTDHWKEIGGQFIISYVDGIRPSLIYQYKNRLANGNFQGSHAAWSFRNRTLQLDWARRFQPGEETFHQVRAADVTGDGRDNFVEGGFVLEHNGNLLNLHVDAIHGDRHTLADIDPDRPGLEHFVIQQNNPRTLGMALYDAATGEMIRGIYLPTVADVGRGICGAFDATRRGLQFWATMNNNAMYDSKGNLIEDAFGTFPGEAMWWGPDLARWQISGIGSGGPNLAFHRFNPATRRFDRDLPNLYNEMTPYYFRSINAGRAAFWGDILGDWREEMVCVRSDWSGFVVLTTWEVSNHRLYNLMQNPAYRIQTTARGYYQTADVDFYMANDMPRPPVPPVQIADIYHTPGGWINFDELPASYADGATIMYDIRGGAGNNNITLSNNMSPSRVFLMNPRGVDYTFSGSGKFTGEMDIIKSMQGTVVFNGQHDFVGITRISEGRLIVTGDYPSPVQLDARGIIGGNANLLGGITIERGLNRSGARIEPGGVDGRGNMTIQGNLTLSGRNNLAFKIDQTKTPASSHLSIQGNLTVSGVNNCIIIEPLTPIKKGTLTLISFSGTTNINASTFTIVGMEGIPYNLRIENNAVIIDIQESRVASQVNWQGGLSAIWDFQTSNFLKGNISSIFVPGDTIIFNDNAIRRNIIISETMPVGGMTFINNSDFSISGQGIISGTGGLLKSGTGRLSIQNTENTFTGRVEINGGTLEVSSLKDGGLPSSIGSSSSAAGNWIMQNATLQTRAQMSTNRNMQVIGTLTVNNPNSNNSVVKSGNIQGSNVTLEVNGSGMLTLQGNNSLSQVIVNNGLLFLGSADGNRHALGNARIRLNGGTLRMFDINTTSNTGTFSNEVEVPEGRSARWDAPSRWGISSRLIGAGILQFHIPFVRTDLNGDWSQFRGRINFTGRDIRLNSEISRNIPSAEVNLGPDTYLMVGTNGSSEVSVGHTFTFGALSGSGSISGRNSLIVGALNTNTLYSGTITSGSGQLTKRGTGNLTLSGANNYTGITTVQGGQLILTNTTGSATGTGTILVSTGATLSGTGTASGTVQVNSGATISAGTTATTTGNLRLGSNLVIRQGGRMLIKTIGTLNDRITVTGGIQLSGTLEMSNLGAAYAAGRSFTIFTSNGNVSGEFENIVPITPGEGLAWNLSRINEGIISIDNATSLNNRYSLPVEVYPTSTNHYLNIRNNGQSNELRLELRSLTGLLIMSDIIFSLEHKMDISSIASGYYLLHLRAGDQSKVVKIIKN